MNFSTSSKNFLGISTRTSGLDLNLDGLPAPSLFPPLPLFMLSPLLKIERNCKRTSTNKF